MKKSYDFSKGRQGAIIPVPGKMRITIRIDEDILDWFRKQAHDRGGGNYQTMINDALREYIESEAEPLEETFRRVLGEVLPGTKKPSRKRAKTTRKKRRRKASRKKASSKKRA